MAQLSVRLNTQASSFPLTSDLSGRTTIDGRGDLVYVPGLSTDGDVPQDRGVPNVMYAHNVMPSTYGWQSIGFERLVENEIGNFQDIILIQGAVIDGDDVEAENLRTYVSKADYGGGTAYLRFMQQSYDSWQDPEGENPAFPLDSDIFVATINGYSYIAVERVGVYVYTIATNTLTKRELKSLEAEDVVGVVANSGYLLAWTSRSVVWSSSVDPEDFEPSEVSGAGGGSVQDARGSIIVCLPTSLGVIVFTDINAVSCVYTGNENFPFEFKAVPGSGGIESKRQVSEEPAGGYQYSFTTNGIERVTHAQATTTLNNITDFVGGNKIEDFNEATDTLVNTFISQEMSKSIAVVSNRYICVSYGNPSLDYFTHAIIVDIAQGRMGKIRYNHRKIFELRSIITNDARNARSSFGLLTVSGEVYFVNFDTDRATGTGVILYGKLQYARNRMLQLQEVVLENSTALIDNVVLKDLPSYNGKSLEDAIEGYNNPTSSDYLKEFLFSNVATSHSLLVKGTFNIVSLSIVCNLHSNTFSS